ncbi:hypothetical protein [Echinimonas agarilytica]|uniref:MSHA biogenesis protein MshK n=1 Tax=Echinimonas agarilytica TaxID=1215918 RepID=A0AA42B6E9_9GAMM|nr:hypothetical protein [Echinimonas agarilytica]MCM2678579.1 hypothetical protein [Echinimonas agarilytica]
MSRLWLVTLLNLCSFAVIAANENVERMQLTDPTRPIGFREVASQGGDGEVQLRLQQIMTSESRQYAVIDGRIVSVGQVLGEYTVLAITPSAVTLEKQDLTTVTLTMFKSFKK